MTRYRLVRRAEIELEPAPPDRSSGLTRALLVGGHTRLDAHRAHARGARGRPLYSGITVKMLVDKRLDAQLHR
jgi:hypothetical protein